MKLKMPEVIKDHHPEADAPAESVDPFVIELFRVDVPDDVNEVQVRILKEADQISGGLVTFVFCAWTEWNRGNNDRVSISRDSFMMSMVFSNSPGMGEQNIYVNPVDGYDPKCLTSGIYARSPVYSPDGSKIFYIAIERTGDDPDDYEESICMMNADGSDQTKIIGVGKITGMCIIASDER